MLIGICGKAGAGKDTVADIILSLVPESEKYSFAAPLKEMALAIDPIIGWESSGHYDDTVAAVYLSDEVNAVGWDEAKQNPEVRRFLQRLGTEGVRGTFGDDAWVNLMWDWYYDKPEEILAVIPDTRFPNEAEAIQSNGSGVVVQVIRPDAYDLGDNGTHPSEALAFTPDYTIFNDSDLAALQLRTEELLERLGLL